MADNNNKPFSEEKRLIGKDGFEEWMRQFNEQTCKKCGHGYSVHGYSISEDFWQCSECGVNAYCGDTGEELGFIKFPTLKQAYQAGQSKGFADALSQKTADIISDAVNIGIDLTKPNPIVKEIVAQATISAYKEVEPLEKALSKLIEALKRTNPTLTEPNVMAKVGTLGWAMLDAENAIKDFATIKKSKLGDKQ